MEVTETQWILDRLPYEAGFRFVDGISDIDADGVEGHYFFDGRRSWYTAHFKGHPITPGVLLTECCAQIGVVCLGIFLLGKEQGDTETLQIGMSSMEMDFLQALPPNEKVRVVSEKSYFRFGKLKCRVKLFNSADTLICSGEIAGMIRNKTYG